MSCGGGSDAGTSRGGAGDDHVVRLTRVEPFDRELWALIIRRFGEQGFEVCAALYELLVDQSVM